MTDVVVRTLDGETTALTVETVDSLRAAIRGSVCMAGEPGYDEARTIWNGMIDRAPALVVRCAGGSDVIQAVRLAKAHGLMSAVRAGGHNIAGNAVCQGGLLIDLSGMTSVRVDPVAQCAWVEPGATLRDLDMETQAHGLAVPVGINSTTGVAGLTLGGGFGWITRKYGMTIDNLLAVDIVTADGELHRANETENADLFWAVRGGGGNFGVVTSFEFKLSAVGPQVLSGLIVHPFEGGNDLLAKYGEIAKAAPDELTCWAVLRKAPPLPFLPEEWHGREVIVFALCYVGDLAEGEKAIQPIRDLGEPIADVVSPHAFIDWQTAFDPLLTPGARNYWKSHDFAELSDATLAIMLDYAGRLPTPDCEIFIAHLGGAMSRISNNVTAFPQRQSHFIMNVHTRWQEAAQDDTCIQWARDFFDATAQYAVGTVYVNFMPEDETDRVRGAYGGNYDKLAAVKAKYDPSNLFRLNQNIVPATAAEATA